MHGRIIQGRRKKDEGRRGKGGRKAERKREGSL
jgi:hypothetical protein